MAAEPVPAIVLAGSRPGPDPLVDGSGVATKALIPIAGEPMLVHVLRTLLATPEISRILVLAQDSATLAAAPAIARLAADGDRLRFADSGAGISSSLLTIVEDAPGPMLVTTADNVLLTPAMVTHFVGAARGGDVAVAMVERRNLLARFPQSRRTWLKFRGGAWSGANLFWFGGRQVEPLLQFWAGIEQERKKGLKIIAAFGPVLLAAALLRLITIQQGVTRAARRFGLNDARIVAMPQAEACIDADKPADIALIEQILAARQPFQAAFNAASTAAAASASS